MRKDRRQPTSLAHSLRDSPPWRRIFSQHNYYFNSNLDYADGRLCSTFIFTPIIRISPYSYQHAASPAPWNTPKNLAQYASNAPSVCPRLGTNTKQELYEEMWAPFFTILVAYLQLTKSCGEGYDSERSYFFHSQTPWIAPGKEVNYTLCREQGRTTYINDGETWIAYYFINYLDW